MLRPRSRRYDPDIDASCVLASRPVPRVIHRGHFPDRPLVPRLYLLRHAKSSWDDPGLPDHDRPLAPRGRKAAKRMGAHLRERGIEPQLVLCSSARRTRETVERLALPSGSQVEVEDGLYAAGSGD